MECLQPPEKMFHGIHGIHSNIPPGCFSPCQPPESFALVPVSSSSISRRQVGRRRRRGMAGLSSGEGAPGALENGGNSMEIHPKWEKNLGEIWGYNSWLVVQHFTTLKNDGVSSSMGSG